MNDYRKTFIGSIIAFFFGTSCCWLSAIAVWLGGATFLGVLIAWIENVQTQLVLLSIGLLILSVYLYQKKKNSGG